MKVNFHFRLVINIALLKGRFTHDFTHAPEKASNYRECGGSFSPIHVDCVDIGLLLDTTGFLLTDPKTAYISQRKFSVQL